MKIIFFSSLLFMLFSNLSASTEIIILSECNNKKDGFIKNEYILNLEKSLMTRNFIYNDKTFKKYKITDLSIKKKNLMKRFIYEEEGIILTDKIGYPSFYTQLVFERNNTIIKIKTVINNEAAFSDLSICNKMEVFDKES